MYEIQENLHQGHVWSAQGPAGLVVLKKRRGYEEEFPYEREILQTVRHDHVVRLLGEHVRGAPQTEPRGLFLVLEHVPGLNAGSLNRMLPRDSAYRSQIFSDDLIAQYAAQLTAALLEIKGAGYVHRDVKPRNVIIGPAGVKLIDFNCAVPIHTHEEDVPVGTRGYMSHEHLEGRSEPSMDVFGLGCTLYVMKRAESPYLLHCDGNPQQFMLFAKEYLRMGPKERLKRSRQNNMIMAMCEPRARNRPTLEEVVKVFPLTTEHRSEGASHAQGRLRQTLAAIRKRLGA